MAIEARNRTLPDWFTRFRLRQTVLPRFQRFEAWGHASVTQLFNTILQDLPLGAVLVLEVGNEEPFISRPINGAPELGEKVTEHLLDGQQRMTALWRGLCNNYVDRKYFLVVRSNQESGLPYVVDSVARSRKLGEVRARPYWADEPLEQWSRRMVPLELCAPDLASQGKFREWARTAVADTQEREVLSEQIAEVRQKFASFNVPFLSLPVKTRKEVALDVFIKMNTSGVELTIFDVLVAQLEAELGQSLHELVAKLRAECPAVADYYSIEDLVLSASALLQGRIPANATYMAKGFGISLLENWKCLLEGVKRASAFLEEEKIFDAKRLPTDVVVPVLTALWAHSPKGLDGEGYARAVMRKYTWRAFFTQRYERTTNQRALSDYHELKALIQKQTASCPVIFDDAQYPLPRAEDLALAGWPKKKERLARAILAFSLKQGGLDLADGGTVTRASLAQREYHHLFPNSLLKGRSVPDDKIYIALNCALVTWNTNRNISNKDPERYLAERRNGTGAGETEVRARLASHLVPYDEMVAGNYDAFLLRRASMMHNAMLNVCGATLKSPADMMV